LFGSAVPSFRSLIAATNTSAFLVLFVVFHSFVRPRHRHSSVPTADRACRRAQALSRPAAAPIPEQSLPSPGRALTAPSTEVDFIQRAGRSRLYSVLPFMLGGRRLRWPIVLFAVQTSLIAGRIMAFRFRRRYDPDALNSSCRCRKNRAVADARPSRDIIPPPVDPRSGQQRSTASMRP
jgi:hypothetical protein